MDRQDHALGLWTSKGIEAPNALTMFAPYRHDLPLADRSITTRFGRATGGWQGANFSGSGRSDPAQGNGTNGEAAIECPNGASAS